MQKRIAPETRLQRAAHIVRAIESIGGRVSVGGLRLVHDGAGKPLFRQLVTFYDAETFAYLRTQLVIDRMDHV
jgi:hypothetical protein